MQIRFITNEINELLSTREDFTRIFVSFSLLFIPFFINRVTWGLHNEFQPLYMHIPQAAVVATICLVSLINSSLNKRQLIIINIFSFLFAIHLIQSVILSNSLIDYRNDFFSQGILLWAYLFSVCLYASTIKVKNYRGLLYFFDLLSKVAVLVAIVFYLLYKLTGIAVLIHFYEGFGIARLQGFFSEPSAFAPVSCWLLLFGIKNRNLISVGLAMVVCVLSFSPIVIICTLLAFITYLMIFHPRVIPLILLAGVFIAAWITEVDCSVTNDGSSLIRSACGVKSIFSDDTRNVYLNDRLISSIAIFEYLSVTNSLTTGLGINSTSVFMPIYYGEMRDNSLLISIIAFYGAIGGIVFMVTAAAGLFIARRKKNIYSIFWISFFYCSIINSAQGFVTYALLFVASILLLNYPGQKNSINN